VFGEDCVQVNIAWHGRNRGRNDIQAGSSLGRRRLEGREREKGRRDPGDGASHSPRRRPAPRDLQDGSREGEEMVGRPDSPRDSPHSPHWHPPEGSCAHHDLAMAWRGVAKEGKERGSGARSYCCVAELNLAEGTCRRHIKQPMMRDDEMMRALATILSQINWLPTTTISNVLHSPPQKTTRNQRCQTERGPCPTQEAGMIRSKKA